MELWLWEKIHLEGAQRVLDTDGLETLPSPFLWWLCAGAKLLCQNLQVSLDPKVAPLQGCVTVMLWWG